MDFDSFLTGVFLINQMVILFIVHENRNSTRELTQSIQRLCSFLSSNGGE